MFRNKSSKTTYGIVGLGRFGQALAQELAESGAELIVLDRDEEKVSEIRELTENAYIVKDDIEYGMRNVIPLWTFGFLY